MGFIALGTPGRVAGRCLVAAVTGALVGLPVVLVGVPAAQGVGAQTVWLVSRGTPPSSQPAISSDGRHVAFASDAGLVAGDTNAKSDIYLARALPAQTPYAGSPVLVSADRDGGDADGRSSAPAVSADGHFVAFTSDASDLVPGADSAAADVYLRDTRVGTTLRIQGSSLPDGASSQPAISASGRYVVFTSSATNLVAGDTNGVSDVFRYDRETGALTRVSRGSSGAQLGAPSYDPAISGDGSAVSFTSENTGLDGASPVPDPGFAAAWHVRFGTSGDTVTPIGAAGRNQTGQTSLSGDGTVVAYVSNQAAYHGISGMGTKPKVFVESLGGHWEWVSDGLPLLGSAVSAPALSADGSTVAFVSGSSVRLAETEKRHGKGDPGFDGTPAPVVGPANGSEPAVSASGRTVALSTTTSLPGDGDTARDVAVVGTVAPDQLLHPALDTFDGLLKPRPLPFVDPAKIPASATAASTSQVLGGTKIGGTKIGGTKIGGTKIGGTKIGGTKIGGTKIGGTKIGGTKIGGTKIGGTKIGDLPLSEWILDSPDGWEIILRGTPFEGLPLDSITLNQVSAWAEANAGNPAADVIRSLTLAAFSSDSPLGQLTFMSVLLLDKPLSGIPLPGSNGANLAAWRDAVAAQGLDPAVVTDGTTLLDLDGLGLDIELTQVGVVSASEVAPAATAMPAITVHDLFLDNPLGNVLVTELPDAVAQTVLDCSGGCPTGTLAENAGRIRTSATLADLVPGLPGRITLDEVVRALIDPVDFPWENLAWDAIGVGRYNIPEDPAEGERTGVATVGSFRAGFDTGPGGAAYVTDAVLDVQLPPGTAFHDAAFRASGPLEYTTTHTPEGGSADGRLVMPWSTEDLGDVVRFHLGDVPSGTTVTVTVRATDAVNYDQDRTLRSVLRSSTGQDDALLTLQGFAGYADLVDPPEGDDPAGAEVLQENRIYFGGITSTDDVDYVRIPRPGPGQRLIVANGTDGGNLDLGIFQLSSADEQPANGAAPGPPGAVALLEEPTDAVAGSHMQPGALNLLDLKDYSLLDASTHTGTQEEVVTVDGDGRGGELVVRIQGAPIPDRTEAADRRVSLRPYTLRYRYVDIEPEQRCPSYDPGPENLLSRGVMPPAILPGTNTIFLVDQQRMTQEYPPQLGLDLPLLTDAGAWVVNELTKLDGQFGLKTAVIPITGLDPLNLHNGAGVLDARHRLDRNPCSASAANDLAGEIREVLDSYLTTPEAWAAVKNVIFVGGDDQIPFWRVPGATFGATETGNEGALRLADSRGASCAAALPGEPPTSACDGRATPLSAAAHGDFVLTDDPYGDADPISVLDRNLYVSDVATARLVESPEQIRQAVHTYLQRGGKYRADEAFSAGYGAWDEMPAALTEALAGRVGGHPTLTGTWDKADLEGKLFPPGAASPHLVSVNAHMSEDALLPGVAGASDGVFRKGDLYTTEQVEAVAGYRSRLAGRILFPFGCHAAGAMPDTWYGEANQDWAETLGGVGGYVAATGYAVADDAATSLTERLLVEYASRLGRPGVTSGEALAAAKQAYLDGLGLYLGYDEKILMQTTYFGMPMYTVDGNAGQDPEPDPGPDPGWGAGTADGLTTRSATFSPQFEKVTTPRGVYDRGDGGIQASPGNPLLPRTTTDLPAVGGAQPHGVLITGLDSTRSATSEQLAVAAADTGGGTLSARLDDIGFPTSLGSVSGQRLTLITGRVDADSTAAATSGFRERFTRMGTRVYYSASGDHNRPFAESTSVRNPNGTRTVTVAARDAEGPVKAAYLLYQTPGAATWTFATMARQGISDSFTATLPATARWLTQVVDGAGNVTPDLQRGYLGQASQQAPVFDGGGDAEIRENGELIRELDITDGDSERFTGRVDWGFGWQEMEINRLPDGSVEAILHLVGQRPGTFPVRIEICDDSGLCTERTFTLTVRAANTAPQATVTLDDTSPVTDQVLHAEATAVDADGDPVTLRYQWWVNGEAVDGATGTSFDLGQEGHGDEGDTVTVTVVPNDGQVDGGGSSASAVVRRNTAPTAGAGPDTTVAEGSAYSSTGSYTDPDGDDMVSGTVDYGDGSPVQPLTPGATFPLSHTYVEDGSYTVTVTVTDEHGGSGTDTAYVTVTNVPPTILPNVAPAAPVPIGDPTTITVAWDDPGTTDTHTVQVDWGDGTTSPATVDQATRTATATHTYLLSGTYVIGVTVTDDDGGSTTESPYDFGVVFDSTDGYVTANGFYDSPVGAWPANPTKTGQAELGMNARFGTGNPLPTGKMRFTYDITPLDHGCAAATCLQFDSTAYTSLVISGSKATLKGRGTLNGASGHTFLVSVIDGSPDRVRVKIMNRFGKVVYDSQLGAADSADPTVPLSGGSVLLKKAG